MPRKLSRAVRLLTAMTAATFAIGAAPAVAAACEFPQTRQAFAQFGDANHYYLAPGGDFETLTWDATNARLATGNDPFNLAPGARSLRLAGNANVTSPAFCVSQDTPHLRFVARSLGGNDLQVHVRVWRNGQVVDHERTTVPAAAHRPGWAPSGNVSLRTNAFVPGETATVTVTFETDAADWLVDNVFIDPYRR